MKRQEVCPNCKRKFWTTVIKVYVFKQRYCDKCDVKLKVKGNELICPKCGKAWKLGDLDVLSLLKTEVGQTTRNFLLAEKARQKGIEIETVLIPDKQMCQRCRNVSNMMQGYMKKQRKKAQEKVLSKEDSVKEIRQAVMNKHRQEWQERQQKEKIAKMMEAKKAQQKAAKKTKTAKLIKDKKHKSTKVDKMVVVTESNFDQIANNPLVLIDCWAPWCKPCLVISPIVEELAKEYAGKITVGKLNVDENKAIANRFSIMGIPTLLIIRNGKEIDRIVGVASKDQIRAKLEEYLKGEK